MKTPTKRTVYAIKEDCDNSMRELHETKESAIISLRSMKKRSITSDLYIEEVDVLSLAFDNYSFYC
tara:strand:- start:551 stop:748 length:198 start_codon:yes stop_codon:yes gene_type:complete